MNLPLPGLRRKDTMRLTHLLLAACTTLFAACDLVSPTTDAGPVEMSSDMDAGAPQDAGPVPDGGPREVDAGSRMDAGPREDAGERDAGVPADAGSSDAGTVNVSCAGDEVSVVDYFTGARVTDLSVTLDGSALNSSGGIVCAVSLTSAVHPLSISAQGYATWNGALAAPGGATSRTVRLFPETPAMSAWLAQVNLDRAANGAGAVQLDDMLSIAAFDHASDMATQNYFAHFDPHGFAPTTRSLLLGSMVMGAENIAAGDNTWKAAESTFMAEKSALPNQAPGDCATHESAAGHYCNIVWPTHNWVGLAIVSKSGSRYGTYYDQEFGDLYGSYDTSEVPAAPAVGTSAAVQFVAANGATIQGENMELLMAPVAIPIATLNADPTCASTCPSADQWYPGTLTFPNTNPLAFDFSQEQIYFGEVVTNVTAFVGYGAFVAAFAGGTVAPTQYQDASLNVQTQ